MTDRCAKCILPTNIPGTELDSTGTCHYCRMFDRDFGNDSSESTASQQAALEKILDRVRGRRRYDCLVPISGGKDSMYVLYVLAKTYRLSVLAYNFANGFQSPRAAENMQRAVQRLGVDFVIYQPRQDVMLSLFRAFLTRAGEFCSPCNMLIGAAAQRIARQNGILLIMSGTSKKHSAGIDGISQSQYYDLRYYRNVLEGVMDFREFEPYVVAPPLVNAFRRVTRTGPEAISALGYFDPGPEAMVEVLEKELGWEPPSEELEHGDCILNPLKDYIQYRQWGCTEVVQAYSALVRTGEMDREEALRRAEAEQVKEPPAVLDMFLERIGMTHQEFEDSRRRHFTEFENYQRSGLYNASRRVWRTVRGVK